MLRIRVIENESSFRPPEGGGIWRREPFRIFFPLGVLLAWIGISHWLLYAAGLSSSYSCQLHGLVQVQAFMMSFAVGFLMTALPRRTQGPPPSTIEMTAAALALITVAVAMLAGRRAVAQAAYASLFGLLLQFAIRRFVGRAAGRRPPAAFVLIPIGILHGLLGAGLIAAAPGLSASPWAVRLGPLLVEQGVFLCFTVGVGSLILPLMGGAPPPADLDSSPRERVKAFGYAAIGLAFFVSFVLEASGWTRSAPLLRAAVDALGLGIGGGARRPRKPGLHRQLAWVSIWMMPVGLAASGLLPDYRVPALHILFIGGFGLLVFAVATHVSFSHLDLQDLALGRPAAVVILGISFGLALAARLAADLSHSYFDHLGWAAACWLVGSAVWLAFIGPRLLRSKS
jgi:uncharacterized protein involved in response to NO